MRKNNAQRSIYCPDEDWAIAKEVAWRKKVSVSSLIVEMLRKEAAAFAAEAAPVPTIEPPAEKEDIEL
jgi:hypothetical protein